jgi:hypothetical protein
MEELIHDIFEIIKDYRSDEGDPSVRMTPERIRRWIIQFPDQDQHFILHELRHILRTKYSSKKDVIQFLIETVESLKKKLKYDNVHELLLETHFLNLQKPNKSQPTLLKLLGEVLMERYGFDINLCGSKIRKNFVYLDDVLCTGNTLFQDINKWTREMSEFEETYLDLLKQKYINLVFAYLYIHEYQFIKKQRQFTMKIHKDFNKYYQLIWKHLIYTEDNHELGILQPSADGQSALVMDYQQSIEERVNHYCNENNIPVTSPGFYRRSTLNSEVLFSSPENRKRFEDLMLVRGIEILNNSQTNLKNLRALGYSLPSLKNFGFGAMSMTWRNIPNNCPITFWYSGGGNFPLFVKNQT